LKRLVIVGGGFGGVWAALAGSAQRARLGPDAAGVTITLINPDPWLTIRPRLYEASLEDVRVPLAAVLGPVGVELVEARVTQIDTDARRLTIAGAQQPIFYSCLVLAAGSRTTRPRCPALDGALSVDDFAAATSLAQHLESLNQVPVSAAARSSAVVVGAGFTGIEVATTLIDRLRAVVGPAAKVTIVERVDTPLADMAAPAREHIERALATLGIVVRYGRTVESIHRDGVRLDDGEWIAAATTVWTGGMRASELTAQIRTERDELGRLPVDACQRVAGVAGVYAAGDVARARVDGEHVAPMSCQYATQMGRVAGHNAFAELCGDAPQPFSPRPYVTCIDLGAAGALFTSGWNRDIQLTGYWASIMKQTINQRLIYPPSGSRR
jgi:NADH dehydrogenase